MAQTAQGLMWDIESGRFRGENKGFKKEIENNRKEKAMLIRRSMSKQRSISTLYLIWLYMYI